MTQKIRVLSDRHNDTARFGGFLDGRNTYLWIGNQQVEGIKFIGTLSNRKLYRLAKAIVRQFEKGEA